MRLKLYKALQALKLTDKTKRRDFALLWLNSFEIDGFADRQCVQRWGYFHLSGKINRHNVKKSVDQKTREFIEYLRKVRTKTKRFLRS